LSFGSAMAADYRLVTKCMVRPCVARGFRRCGGYAVLHQCIRPLIGAFCAPGHHGYQRACDLISGQASMGHLGHQCRMRWEDRSSISFLILSQTSAGKGYRLVALNDHAASILLASKARP
jgi:hypothetical protein